QSSMRLGTLHKRCKQEAKQTSKNRTEADIHSLQPLHGVAPTFNNFTNVCSHFTISLSKLDLQSNLSTLVGEFDDPNQHLRRNAITLYYEKWKKTLIYHLYISRIYEASHEVWYVFLPFLC
uniref:Uncharacterized protein n=1 Tax=Parascaris univalens TaxID=6257 RepID=A0A915AW44_PARUN